jgi:ubiquinone/menaquinone biosynthesis C-methylase UbiE
VKEMHKPHTNEAALETKGRTIRWASHYDAFTWLVSLGREPAMRETTLDLAGIAIGEKVLDVGCGTGTLTIAAKVRAGANREVHGIDAAREDPIQSRLLLASERSRFRRACSSNRRQKRPVW